MDLTHQARGQWFHKCLPLADPPPMEVAFPFSPPTVYSRVIPLSDTLGN